MVDVKASQAARFIERMPPELSAVLLYGSDPGLVSERSERIAKTIAADPKRPGEIIRIDEDDLAGDPDRLAVELRTVSMFGDRRIVRLRAESRANPELIADLLAPGVTLEGFLIVEAGNLKPDAKLRKLFVEARNAAAVACYADDAAALSGLVSDVFDQSGLSLTREARDHLIGLLGADRALSRSELEKLALYVGEKREVTIEDVDAVVGDAAELALDQIALAATGREPAVALSHFDRALAAGETVQTVLLALQRHLWRLHQVSAAIGSGKSLDVAMRSLRPPVHFKQAAAFGAQCRTWSPDAAAGALAACQSAIRETRLAPLIEREICERFLLTVAGALPS